MKDWCAELLSCPVCRGEMELFPGKPTRVACKKGHSYDVSRWVNFLTRPVSEHYRKDLFAARRLIWESGLFDPLAERMAGYVYGRAKTGGKMNSTFSFYDKNGNDKNENDKNGNKSMHYNSQAGMWFWHGTASSHPPAAGNQFPQDRLTLLDAGCGEGSPLMRILGCQEGKQGGEAGCQMDSLADVIGCQTDSPECVPKDQTDKSECALGCRANSTEHIQAVGIDLAKDAVRMAAGLTKEISWLVGDLTHLPLRNDCFDVVLNLLSPACYEEFFRVLKPGGLLVKVLPEEDYLKEIRELITVKKETGSSVPFDERKDVFSEDLTPVKITSDENINQLLCTSEKNALTFNSQETTKKQLLFTSREAIADRLNSHFQLIGSERLCYDGVVPSDQKMALVRMTPMCADLSAEECMAVADRLGDKIRIDLRILTATPLHK